VKQALVCRQAAPVAEHDLAAEGQHKVALRGTVLLPDKRLRPPVQDAAIEAHEEALDEAIHAPDAHMGALAHPAGAAVEVLVIRSCATQSRKSAANISRLNGRSTMKAMDLAGR